MNFWWIQYLFQHSELAGKTLWDIHRFFAPSLSFKPTRPWYWVWGKLKWINVSSINCKNWPENEIIKSVEKQTDTERWSKYPTWWSCGILSSRHAFPKVTAMCVRGKKITHEIKPTSNYQTRNSAFKYGTVILIVIYMLTQVITILYLKYFWSDNFCFIHGVGWLLTKGTIVRQAISWDGLKVLTLRVRRLQLYKLTHLHPSLGLPKILWNKHQLLLCENRTFV